MWNHRVLVFKDEDDEYMEICEVYYDGDNKPFAYGEGGNPYSYSGAEGFKELFKYYEEALNKPYLWGDERFPEEYKTQ